MLHRSSSRISIMLAFSILKFDMDPLSDSVVSWWRRGNGRSHFVVQAIQFSPVKKIIENRRHIDRRRVQNEWDRVVLNTETLSPESFKLERWINVIFTRTFELGEKRRAALLMKIGQPCFVAYFKVAFKDLMLSSSVFMKWEVIFTIIFILGERLIVTPVFAFTVTILGPCVASLRS